jgi:hypothetical protein
VALPLDVQMETCSPLYPERLTRLVVLQGFENDRDHSTVLGTARIGIVAGNWLRFTETLCGDSTSLNIGSIKIKVDQEFNPRNFLYRDRIAIGIYSIISRRIRAVVSAIWHAVSVSIRGWSRSRCNG